MTVLAFDPHRTTNARLVLDLVELGYLHEDMDILDLTYGQGAFWSKWGQGVVESNDLDPDLPTTHHEDFTATSFHDDSWDVVVLDPPYGYRGTSRLASDSKYGIAGEYLSVAARDRLIADGVREACRLSRRFVLVKVMDQVVSGTVHWQTFNVRDVAVESGFKVADMLHVRSYRRQPPGRRQLNAHRGASTLLVLAKEKR